MVGEASVLANRLLPQKGARIAKQMLNTANEQASVLPDSKNFMLENSKAAVLKTHAQKFAPIGFDGQAFASNSFTFAITAKASAT